MAFSGTSTLEIAEEIEEREQQVGRLAMVVNDFDASELADLRSQVRLIVSGSSWETADQTLVMAFALWICKTRFLTQQAFWQEFERQLGVTGVDQNYIRNSLLEPAFFHHNITLWMIGNSRRFVTSLMEERQEALATLSQVIGFFSWYFRNSLGLPVTDDVLARYRQRSGEGLPLTAQAVEALSEDCQKLARIVELAVEDEVLLKDAPSGWANYCHAVVNLLGTEYDPSKLRIVRDADALRRIILELQNHRTPAQFLRELERFSPNASVQVPKSSVTSNSASVSVANLRTRRADEISYGLYRVQTSTGAMSGAAGTRAEYRVVPCTWLPLETLRGWPLVRLITPRAGWLGYRKNTPFVVSLGERQVTSRRCYFLDNSSTFLWVGEVVPGQKMIVDNLVVPGSEGLSWDIAFRLTSNEQRDPCLSLVLIKLLAFLPEQGGAKVEVSTSQNHREVCHVEADGSLALYRGVRFELREFAAPVTVQVKASGFHKERTFAPAPARLFSALTREEVAPNRLHRQDGRRFVLFCQPDEEPQGGQGVVLTPIESGTDPLRAWQVEWTTTSAPFALRVGQLRWDIERQLYFEAWLESHEPLVLSEGGTGLMLGVGQRHSFTEGMIRVTTNWTLDTDSLRCRFSRGGNVMFECPLAETLEARRSDGFMLSASFVRRLNEAVEGFYGYCTLRFYQDDVEEDEHVLAELRVSIVPRVGVQLGRRLILESEAVPLQVESPHVPLWNAHAQKSDEATILHLFPTLEVLPSRSDVAFSSASEEEDNDTSGVPRLKPQVVSGLVAMPTLSESLRVAALPVIFGFRLGRRLQNGEWWECAEADWFALDEFSLRVFTGARALVKCSVNGQGIWQNRADGDGQILLDTLSHLKPLCQAESTTVTLASTFGGDTVQSSFKVRWVPRVLDLGFDGEAITVRSSGPRETAIVLRFEFESASVDEILPCIGDGALLRCALPQLPSGESPQFVVTSGWGSGGDLVPSSHRLTLAKTVTSSLNTCSQSALSDEWLRAGVGFSSLEEMQRHFAH